MSLQFILGPSGCGKTQKMYEMIIEHSIRYPDEQCVLIVPEQYTLVTQKRLFTMHPSHGAMNIDITSFENFACKVFKETGHVKNYSLSDAGQSMVIRKLLCDNQANLTVLRNIRQADSIKKIKSLLTELLQYNISPEKLDGLLDRLTGTPYLKSKLSDINLVYNAFKKMIEDNYLTSEETLALLCSEIDRSKAIRCTTLYFDGFTSFTPLQYNVLSNLVRCSKSTYITLTLDGSDANAIPSFRSNRLFNLTKETYSKIDLMCFSLNIRREVDICLTNDSMNDFIHPEIKMIEKSLYGVPIKKYEKKTEAVTLIPCTSPEEEIAQIMKEIHHLAKIGYSYGDIAIVTSDLSRYEDSIRKYSSVYQIPIYTDARKRIRTNMLLEWTRSFVMMIQHFTNESVIRYLRSGLAGFDNDEIDRLENYLLRYGINEWYKWLKPWTSHNDTTSTDELLLINELRKQFISVISEAMSVYHSGHATCQDMIRQIFLVMQKLSMKANLLKQKDKFAADNNLFLAKEYEQVYDACISLYEEMNLLIGNTILPVSEFYDILDAGIKEMSIGIIPPGTDEVTIGDVKRSHFDTTKILFFAGMNDSILPMYHSEYNILSDTERAILCQNNILLSPSAKEELSSDHFYIYAMLTKPTHHLYLTYSYIDSDGNQMHPASVLNDLWQLFPLLTTRFTDINSFDDQPSALYRLSYGLRNFGQQNDYDIETVALYKWFLTRSDSQSTVHQMLQNAFFHHKDNTLSKAAVNALYGNELTGSTTMLEKYASCAFSHFLDYGLKLQARKVYELTAPDIGIMMHTAIEMFSKRLTHSNYSWIDVPDKIRDQLAKESAIAAINNYNDVINSTARTRYLGKKVLELTKRTVWALQKQLQKGDFHPYGSELTFNTDIESDSIHITCGDENSIHFTGKIDRLDRFDTGNQSYIRIIDYKSGNASFDETKVVNGLQIQLIVYLDTAIKLFSQNEPQKLFIPSGILYYHFDDPLAEKNINSQDSIHNEILGSLAMDGLLLDDEANLFHTDHYPDYDPAAFPFSYKKDGSLSMQSKVESSKYFEELTQTVNEKIRDLASHLYGGEIPINPYSYDGHTACSNCQYKSICGFDPKLEGNSFRTIPKRAAIANASLRNLVPTSVSNN